MLSPDYAIKTMIGGVGFLTGLALPNWLFGGQTWYTTNPWVKVAVRGAFGLVVMPLLASFLPGNFAAPLLIGAGIAVGVSALAELTGRGVLVGGPADLALTPATFFPALSGVVGNQPPVNMNLGAYTRQMLARATPFGAYSRRILPHSFRGLEGIHGDEAHSMGNIYN